MAFDHKTYVIKSGGRPQGSGSYGSPETVKSMIDATQPGRVTSAANAYDAMGNAIIDAQNALWNAAKVLADHWSGPAADTAQQALRRLYATAGELIARSNETAKTLQWYGGSILPMYKAIKWPEKNTDTPPALAAADQVMRNLNERIAQTWDGMPPQIEENLPHNTDQARGPSTEDLREQGGTGGGAAGSGGSGQGSGASHIPAHSTSPHVGGSVPQGFPAPSENSFGIPHAPGADLAGAPPSTSGALHGGLGPENGLLPGKGALGTGSLAPGASGSGALGAGFGSGGITRGVGSFSPGGPRPNLPEEPLHGTSQGTRAGQSERSGQGGSGRRSNGEAGPLTSAGGRRDERERERTTWLAEDPDFWAGEFEAVSGVIGDEPKRIRQSKQDEYDLLTVDELQKLLDLVDEPAKETGEERSQPATHDVTDGSAFLIQEHPSGSITETIATGDGDDFVPLGDDFFDLDDYGTDIRRD
jgi:Proteins of 100 residues with WXG